jgi:hypothetical protein
MTGLLIGPLIGEREILDFNIRGGCAFVLSQLILLHRFCF